MLKMIAVDMDGTFLNSKSAYNKELFTEIYSKVKAEKIKFVVASGNQYYQLRSFFPDIHHELSFVAENGALVIEEGKEIFCGQMSPHVVEKVLDLLLDQENVHIVLCGRKSAYILESESAQFKKHMAKYYHRLESVNSLREVKNDKLFKFAIAVPEEETNHYLKKINEQLAGEVSAVSSGNRSIDLIIPGLHKANGLSLLQKNWGIPSSDIIAFGDGGNDIEMLKYAGYGYAMANASPEVLKIAEHVAPSNDDEGVLTILKQKLGYNN
ncbi:Cof-type HAD-IIB family hydrolase [Amphibacillus sp. Q70]|uniref:Cof-type HAD-IIB family hydrolase n=1 Tax=Amphibacillus sp. Q70 TaxID=3453416 RepID=UPI003F841312